MSLALEDRDRMWCAALLCLGPVDIAAVTGRFLAMRDGKIPVPFNPASRATLVFRTFVPAGTVFNVGAVADLMANYRDGGCIVEVTYISPGVYCGGDHCSGLWNIPCEDPRHPKTKNRAEGV
jgi:hypothetical protein